jgi:dolichyl-diphosphooligosaccharide--protein glycosyltransferase
MIQQVKFFWTVRVWPNEIQEPNYFKCVDSEASPAVRDGLMYKMSYYHFWKWRSAARGLGSWTASRVPVQGLTLQAEIGSCVSM